MTSDRGPALDGPQIFNSFSPKFQKILSARNLSESSEIEKFISADISTLHDPFFMKGIREAVLRIQKALQNSEQILIHGDYDVDGITGSAIVAKMLEILGAKFTVFLPERVQDGYGVSERALKEGRLKGASLAITVDCGVTAIDQIASVRSMGMDVIVIDHHQLSPKGLPNANVIINPNQEDCPYPFKGLSAGGLAFKLAQALLGKEAYQVLDLATLSTICDVAPLVEENRVIVKHGLQKIGEQSNLGIKHLIQVAQIKSKEIGVGHVGFMIGPRINAAGRMSSADIAFRILVSNHEKEAESLARVLDEENKIRQKEERQVLDEAIREVERTFHFNRDRVIVVGKSNWHPGVIGIVAARLVERFYRPAFVISFKESVGKGSGRSIKGFHLFQALQSSSEALVECGGHEQAAGLSILPERMEEFRRLVNAYAHEHCGQEIFQKVYDYDLEISFPDFNLNFLEELKLLEPHGAGNPKPVFLTRNLLIRRHETIPKIQKVKLWLTDGNLTYEGLLPQADSVHLELTQGQKYDLIYSASTKFWNGEQSLVLEIKQLKAVN